MRVVVIGAGFAGLAAALRLRQAGADVTVLDALPGPGGKAALGWADVPSGPTVVTMPGLFRALAARLAWPAPDLTLASPLTAYHAQSGRTFAPQAALHGGLAATLAQLTPAERPRFQALLNTAREIYEGAAGTFLFAPPPGLPALARYGLRHGLAAKPGLSLAQLVHNGPFLTPFWLRFATYLGADPYRAPAVLHNIAWVELGEGVWHLRGGLRALAGQLHAEAERRGVEFRWNTRVERLETQGGRITAAHTGTGALRADAWVSAVDHHLTRAWLGRPITAPRLGVSGFALQLRLEETHAPAHHLFWPADYAREWADIRAGRLPRAPTLYLHLDGRAGFLLVNAPPREVLGGDREAYAAFLLRSLHSRFPLAVTEARALTPAEYARTSLHGALYGRAPHGLTGSLRPGWTIQGMRNLAQVGGTVHPGGGVPLSVLSGWNGAGTLLGLPYDPLQPPTSG